MGKIEILSSQEAQKIAAGEVVERPASVVKELLENSLDAQADQVNLYVEKSGKTLIRVVDNGCGMSLEDARLCFKNHATSKIRFLNDLKLIDTFGFRGEALAAVSSVSKVTLITKNKQNNNEVGIQLFFNDGVICEECEVSSLLGTDVQVRDLFYNIPVRKKFLKQDETEWNQIQGLFYAFCLSNLDVNFKLYRDDKLILNIPAVESIRDRVSQIWGHNFEQNMVDLDIEKEQHLKSKKDAISFQGLISNNSFWRYGRQAIFFFVNCRWVKNYELSKALMKGYRNVLPPARFPAAFIFITVDNSLVDINVHPRKEEVRFVKPVTIENTLHRLVTHTLENFINKQLQPQDNKLIRETVAFHKPVKQFEKELSGVEDTFNTMSSFEKLRASENIIVSNIKEVNAKEAQTIVSEKLPKQEVIKTQESVNIIGQVLKTYILIENKNGLLIIDQHAAHERILYEKFLKNFEEKDGTRLMFPELLKLNKAQLEFVLQEKEFFKKQGIEIEQFGQNEIAIKTSPPKIQSSSLRELIFEIIEFIQDNEHLDQEIFRKKLNEHTHGQMACKMAVKAGDVLDRVMMQNIVEQLQQVDNRFICVHGRPTTWEIKQHELEKKFRRK